MLHYYGAVAKNTTKLIGGNYKTDGGVLANQAIHLLDILIYLFGEIRILMFLQV